MKKSLHWIWLGVAANVIIYLAIQIPYSIINRSLIEAAEASGSLGQHINLFNYYYPFLVIAHILWLWITIFFACFGLCQCLKIPFKRKSLWISLACTVGYLLIGFSCAFLYSYLHRSMDYSLLVTQIVNTFFSCITDLVLFVLTYLLARRFIIGKSQSALRWNKQMCFAVILAVAYVAYSVLITIITWPNNSVMINNDIIIQLGILFFNPIFQMVISIIWRGAVLYFLGAAALKSKPRSAE